MLTNLTLSTLIMTLCVLREVPQLWLPAALIDNTIDLGGVAPAHDRLAKIRPLSLSSTTCQSGVLLNHCNQFIHSVRKQMLYSITGWLLSPWLLFMLRTAFFSCFKPRILFWKQNVYSLLSIVQLNVLAWRLRSVSGVCFGGGGWGGLPALRTLQFTKQCAFQVDL